MREGRSGLFQRVSFLGCSGFLEGELHEWGLSGSLSNYFANFYVIDLAIHLLKIDVFEMDTLAIKSLMSGTYITIKKLNIRLKKLEK